MWQHQQRHHIIMHHVFLMHLHRHQQSIPKKEVTLLPCMKALAQVEKDLQGEMVHLNNRVGDKGMGLAICVLP